MENNNQLRELKNVVDLYMFFEGQSSHYSLELIAKLVTKILLSGDDKVAKQAKKLQKEAMFYIPPMTELEFECRVASSANRNPTVPHCYY